jgi:hypothetical protein
MKSLLQLDKQFILLKSLKNFNQLKLRDKILIFRVFILTALMRSALLIIPFKNLRKCMGELNKESSFNIKDEEYKTARRISWSINKVSKYTPWESKCLVQSLTAQYLLSCSKIETTLYLGVSRENNIKTENQDITSNQENEKSGLIAHSWIRSGSFYVTGGEGKNFATVAKFKKGGFR